LINDRFRLERRLGRGGMAAVYLAYDEDLDRQVAVKILQNLAGDGEIRDRFVREARLAAGLAHPNVVSVFDTGEHDGVPYIVMEYVEGASLAEVLARRGRLPPDEVVPLGLQACAGLQHAHDHGLIHRDVKPHNLLVRADGTLKVTDFGIAVSTEATRITTEGTILGTAAYLAPEQVAGEELAGTVDVYGLGAVLYEALTGRPPLRVSSLAELGSVVTRDPEPVRRSAPDVPPALESAVMHALERRPEARPASPADLADELDPAVADAPTVRIARTRAYPRARHRQRPRAVLLMGAAALVVLVVLAVTIALATGDSEPPPAAQIPHRADPAEQARAISSWLRENSR
jgi:eukaryotic-like serine/threonine-protein kinase